MAKRRTSELPLSTPTKKDLASALRNACTSMGQDINDYNCDGTNLDAVISALVPCSTMAELKKVLERLKLPQQKSRAQSAKVKQIIDYHVQFAINKRQCRE